MCALAYLSGEDHHRGMRRRRCYFLEIHDTRGPKASWLLNIGAGVLLSCVAWDTSILACFRTLQDLLGLHVRTRRGLRALSRFCIVLYYDLLRAGLREWR